jgi:hypothetical protein
MPQFEMVYRWCQKKGRPWRIWNKCGGTCLRKQPQRIRGTIIQDSCFFTIGFCLATRTFFWPCIMLFYRLCSVGYMLRPFLLYSLKPQCQTLHSQCLFISCMQLSGDRTMCPFKKEVFDSRLDWVSQTTKTQKVLRKQEDSTALTVSECNEFKWCRKRSRAHNSNISVICTNWESCQGGVA